MDCGHNRLCSHKKMKRITVLLIFLLGGACFCPMSDIFAQRAQREPLFRRDREAIRGNSRTAQSAQPQYLSTPKAASPQPTATPTYSDIYSNYPYTSQPSQPAAPSNPDLQKIDPSRRERLQSSLAGRQVPAQPAPVLRNTPPSQSQPWQVTINMEGVPSLRTDEMVLREMSARLPAGHAELGPEFMTPDGKTRALDVREIHVPEAQPLLPVEPAAKNSSENIKNSLWKQPQPQVTYDSGVRAATWHPEENAQRVPPLYVNQVSHTETAQPTSAPKLTAIQPQETQTPRRISPRVSSPVQPEPMVIMSPENAPVLKTVPPTAGKAAPENQRNFFSEAPQRHELILPDSPWYVGYVGGLCYDEHRFLGECLAGQNVSYSLMEASIIASHPSNPTMANRLARSYKLAETKLLGRILPTDTQLQRAEKILVFMHEELMLGGYQLEQTTMENLFSNGRYNCVTATILYCCLGRAAGLEVRAVELPGHAMCWVKTERGEIDVETTCATWFQYLDDAQTRKRVIRDLIRQAQDDVDTAQVRAISDRELIAKVYYNRGVDFLAVKDFRSALESNAIALLLDPTSHTTRGNLLATINNWALNLCYEGKFTQSAELLRKGILEEPEYAMFRKNHVHVYHCWIDNLYRSGRLQEALTVARLALSEQPAEEHFIKLNQQLQERAEMMASNPSWVR